MTHKPRFADLYSLPEDARIDLIGHRAIDHQEKVAFIVEDDEKADRYLAKLEKRFPGKLQMIERGSGPVKGTVYVKVGPRVV